jgi:hypothetical protein
MITDSLASRPDPAAYLVGAQPGISAIRFFASTPVTGNAMLRIETDRPTVLKFPDTSFTFASAANGEMIFPYTILSNGTLPSTVANLDVTMNFKLSFDNGQTWPLISQFHQKIFVTVLTPKGFQGDDNLSAHLNVTAARLNFVTNQFKGLTTESAMVAKAKDLSFQGANVSLLQTSPWAALDNPAPYQASGLDCISLTAIAEVQLLEVGVNAFLSYAFATTDPNDATEHRFDTRNGTLSQLDFLGADGSPNQFEAYLLLCAGGVTTEAHTFWPKNGPLTPLFPPPVDSCTVPSRNPAPPVPVPHQLSVSVIANTLKSLQNSRSDPNGGRQWWILRGGATLIDGPVPFPVTNIGVQ